MRSKLYIWGSKDLWLRFFTDWNKTWQFGGHYTTVQTLYHCYILFAIKYWGNPRSQHVDSAMQKRLILSWKGQHSVSSSMADPGVAEQHLKTLKIMARTTSATVGTKFGWYYAKPAIQFGVIWLTDHRLAQVTMEVQRDVQYRDRQVRFVIQHSARSSRGSKQKGKSWDLVIKHQ